MAKNPKIVANPIDKFVGYFNPQAEARRLKARIVTHQLRSIGNKLSYDGASSGRRTQGWTPMSTSSNAEISSALVKLRNRSRDLVRNNPYAKRSCRSMANNVVGSGIIPQAVHPSDSKAAKIYDDYWIQWGDTLQCDADGRLDFYGLQQLAVKTVWQSGEVLIRRRRRRLSDDLVLPIQLQVLEPDYLDSFRSETLKNGNVVFMGIEFDKLGRRVAYYLFDEHPGGSASFIGQSYKSKRVPASEIIHMYFVERPGQMRGVPEPAPVIVRMKDYDDYEDASLLRQKIAACFTAFITDSVTPDLPLAGSGTAESSDADDDDYGQFQPGIFEKLRPGQDVRFGQPPTADGGPDFARGKLRGIAAGLDMTYEMMTGDLSNVNFSSGRMGWLEFQRNVQTWHWQLVVPQMCKPVWRWFVESMMIMGHATRPATATWTPPRREMIDPVKETNAIKTQIRSGLLTQSEAIRQQGYDPEEFYDEMEKDNKLLDDKGIVLDTDPRPKNIAL